MFGKEVLEFSRNLESLRDFVELVDAHLEEKNMDSLKEDPTAYAPLMLIMNRQHPDEFEFEEEQLEKMKDRFGSEIEFIEKETEGGKKFEIKLDKAGQMKFSTAMENISKSQRRKSSLHQSSLVTIISYVEWFLAQIIHKYYDKHPDSIGLKDKQLSLNDLYEIGSIEDAKKYLIDTKVESILRGSLTDWIKFLKEQMKLSMSYLSEYQDTLVEAFQRRNLYVHNGGVVNSIYLKNCTIEDDNQPDSGEKLTCNAEYIESILTAFEKTFLLIASELWKKNEPESERRFRILNSMSYEHICNGRYDIGAALAFFLWRDKGQKESDRIMAQINYWQAKKWQDDFSKVRKDIEKADFSAKDPMFIVAKHVLLDEYDEAFGLLPDILRSGKINFDNVVEWPLFKSLREEDGFEEIESEFCLDSSSEDVSEQEANVH